MDYIFDDWKKILSDFQNSVEKDLEEIHKQKMASISMTKNVSCSLHQRLSSGMLIEAVT